MTRDPDNSAAAEDRQTLWLLIVSPAIWAAHFVLSYIGAAIWCGKLTERAGGMGNVRATILRFAVLSLIGIGVTGLAGWRKHSHGQEQPPHDRDTPEDRHRFLRLATLLLSALSAIATIYVVIATLSIGSCH